MYCFHVFLYGAGNGLAERYDGTFRLHQLVVDVVHVCTVPERGGNHPRERALLAPLLLEDPAARGPRLLLAAGA